jgi:hypothetical protein
MNHHQFRRFIKEMPSSIIRLSNINPAHFKAVCMILSMYGDYESGTSIKPSWLTVSKEAGVNRKTAMKVRDYLLDNQLLIETAKTPGNISVYMFGELSTLNDQLSVSDDQLSHIGGHNSTIYTTKYSNNKESKEKILDRWKHITLSDGLSLT